MSLYIIFLHLPLKAVNLEMLLKSGLNLALLCLVTRGNFSALEKVKKAVM